MVGGDGAGIGGKTDKKDNSHSHSWQQLLEGLLKLENSDDAWPAVFYRHGASGDVWRNSMDRPLNSEIDMPWSAFQS